MSKALESDATSHRRAHGVSPDDMAIGVVIGRTSEFFDFFVFAIASVIVFPQRVFPYVDSLTGTLYCFAIFALAFIARPLGTLIFTEIDRRHGRGAKLTTALLLLGTSTVMLAFVPSYSEFGVWAAVTLAVLRIGQGVALGGAWDGLAALLALSAPERKRGWYAMVPQLGAPLGLMVASGLFAFFVSQLSAEDFYSWGWRYPFFVAFALNVVALFARLRIVDTDEFRMLFASRDLQPTPVAQTVREQGRAILIGAFAPLASFALFHMVTVFPLSWIYLYTEETPGDFLLMEAVAASVGLATVALSGPLADRFGRWRLLSMCAVMIAVFSGFAPLLLEAGAQGEIIFLVIGFALLGLSFGQCSGAVASSFSTKYRYTGSALTSDLAWMFGAGFAPFAALWLSSTFGIAMGGLYLLSGAVCTLMALIAFDRSALRL